MTGQQSNGVCDVDFDNHNATLIALHYIPDTHRKFGRPSAPMSHWLYQFEEIPNSLKLDDPCASDDRRGTIIELRTTDHQSVFPPSIHPSGEQIRYDEEGEWTRVSKTDVAAFVSGIYKIGACVLLSEHCHTGERHFASLALAGGLARLEWSRDEIKTFIRDVAWLAGDKEINDRMTAIADTLEKYQKGGIVTGWTKLKEWLPDKVVDTARKWLGVSEDDSPVSRFFLKGTFLPKRAVTAILQERPLLRMGDTISLYSNGVYTYSQRSQQLREYISELFGDRIQPEYTEKILKVCADVGSIPQWPMLDPKRYINFKNGLLDVESKPWRVIIHTPDVYSTLQFPFTYDPTQQPDCTVIDAYINEVLRSDCVATFWEYIGVSYWYGMWVKHIMFIYGNPDSGKNSLMRMTRAAFGEHITCLGLHAIAHGRWAFGDLFGSPLNLCDEMSNISLLENSRLKSFWNGSGTPVPAEHKGERTFSYIPTTGGVFFCNELPKVVQSEDSAFFKRALLLECPNHFLKSFENDAKIEAIIANHLDAFVCRAMEGLQRYIAQGFTQTPEMLKDRKTFEQDNNQLVEWIQGRCHLGADLWSTKGDLHENFCEWSRRHGGRGLDFPTFRKKLLAIAEDYNIELKRKQIKRAATGRKTPQEVWLGISPIPFEINVWANTVSYELAEDLDPEISTLPTNGNGNMQKPQPGHVEKLGVVARSTPTEESGTQESQGAIEPFVKPIVLYEQEKSKAQATSVPLIDQQEPVKREPEASELHPDEVTSAGKSETKTDPPAPEADFLTDTVMGKGFRVRKGGLKSTG